MKRSSGAQVSKKPGVALAAALKAGLLLLGVLALLLQTEPLQAATSKASFAPVGDSPRSLTAGWTSAPGSRRNATSRPSRPKTSS